ncbi:MAG TPA: protein-glutamate O-methyltransferase CheR [Capsulimonadaceae bacterium]|nr:protein-glutamate O-methyltransferase CheR [Capsulimonadaceae bacterium]
MLEFGDTDWQTFKGKIMAATGIRLDDYKPEQMRRRISTLAQRIGASSFTAYFGRIERDPVEMAGFLERMTINVSELFRNPERFGELRELIASALSGGRVGVTRPLISVWSAGCSYGAEVFSLAILFDELKLGPIARFTATDIDKGILERARQGRFHQMEMQNLSPERRDVYFRQTNEEEYFVLDKLRDRVVFSEHDLLTSPYPKEAYDLIACRNVVIYFTDEAKKRVYEGLYSALKPGGVLFIGSTERIPDHRDVGLELIMPFFYRKPLCPGARRAFSGDSIPLSAQKAA